MEYLIWSFEHNAWWKPNERGYTTNIAAAGVYSLDRASEICQNANTVSIDEAMVPYTKRVETLQIRAVKG